MAVIEAAAALSTTAEAAEAGVAAGAAAAGQCIVRRLVDAVWSGGQVVLSPAEAPRDLARRGTGVFGAHIFNDVERVTAAVAEAYTRPLLSST